MRHVGFGLAKFTVAIAVLVVCFSPVVCRPALAAPPRPNVLWICADDLAAYAVGAYGGRVAQTPQIDRVLARGMRFERAFCNSPVCTASRQSFLTGRYPRTIGVTQLKTPLPEREVTLADRLHEAGYDTAAIGKMHFNSSLKHGFDLRLDLAEHQQWLKSKGAQGLPEGLAVQPPWRPFRDPASIWLNSACLPVGMVAGDMPGTWFADEAARYLREHNSERPFFLMVSFTEPHSPFHFPIEYRERARRPAEFVMPAIGADDEAQIPEIFRNLSDDEKQGIAAAYHTSVEFLDANVGRVFAALEASGQAENTLVVFTGDHGYLLGHHGRFEKHCCFEEAIRAPLGISLPGRVKPNAATDKLVEFIDIAPTITGYCGLKASDTLQGRSLQKLLAGEADSHRSEVFIEYSENAEAAIRTGRWKLIYGSGQRERQDGYTTGRPLPGRTIRLYDLEADPQELRNVASQAEHAELVSRLLEQLATHLRRTARQPELIPQTEDAFAVLDFCVEPRDVGSAE